MKIDPKERAKVTFRLARSATDAQRSLKCLRIFMGIMQEQKLLPGDIELTEDEVDSLLHDRGLPSFRATIEFSESLDTDIFP